MSNYHVEAVDKPAALTSQALKSLRYQQVQGLSRRQLIRRAIGAGVGLWLLELSAGTIGFIWPNLASGFGGKLPIGTLEEVKTANSSLPIADGFPAYFAQARAFVILIDPAQQRFIAGEDTTGDGHPLNVRALYQRCPHLGCKPNPCLKNFWMECPCHGSRYDRLGIKALGAHKIKIHLHPEVTVDITALVARSPDEAEFLAKGGALVAETERAQLEAAEAAQRAAQQAAALFEAKSGEAKPAAEGEAAEAPAEAEEAPAEKK